MTTNRSAATEAFLQRVARGETADLSPTQRAAIERAAEQDTLKRPREGAAPVAVDTSDAQLSRKERKRLKKELKKRMRANTVTHEPTAPTASVDCTTVPLPSNEHAKGKPKNLYPGGLFVGMHKSNREFQKVCGLPVTPLPPPPPPPSAFSVPKGRKWPMADSF